VKEAIAPKPSINGDTLTVDLADGRTISVPLTWFPRLSHATPEERANWQLIGRGTGIHWPDLDEDISIESLRPPVRRDTGVSSTLAEGTECP
jgi:hypothetical protein